MKESLYELVGNLEEELQCLQQSNASQGTVDFDLECTGFTGECF
ncbi:hypothetical protein P4U65_27565 [Bacillus pacificus]|nr:hypothetical protein [Bacillus thuringiensis]MED1304222.1 hypothetical protein [Bacillus pacificus]